MNRTFANVSLIFKSSGLWLHQSGVLGASPDGIVTKPPFVLVHHDNPFVMMNPEILEVKCPYTARDKTVVEACETVKDFFIGK